MPISAKICSAKRYHIYLHVARQSDKLLLGTWTYWTFGFSGYRSIELGLSGCCRLALQCSLQCSVYHCDQSCVCHPLPGISLFLKAWGSSFSNSALTILLQSPSPSVSWLSSPTTLTPDCTQQHSRLRKSQMCLRPKELARWSPVLQWFACRI